MSGFAQALPIVLRREGGYVNDPVDRGGATNFGVTQGTYDAWRRRQGAGPRPVTMIEQAEVDAIYYEYWVDAKCDALPWPASAAQFDAAVNHGPRAAARLLQRALNVKADGIVGPVTLAAAEGVDLDELVNEMLWERVRFYRHISEGAQLKFLRGWLGRIIHLREDGIR